MRYKEGTARERNAVPPQAGDLRESVTSPGRAGLAGLMKEKGGYWVSHLIRRRVAESVTGCRELCLPAPGVNMFKLELAGNIAFRIRISRRDCDARLASESVRAPV